MGGGGGGGGRGGGGGGGGGGECIFIYSSSARLTSFEINFISKEISRAEPEYMNIHPPPISALATALLIAIFFEIYKNQILTVALLN